jgi:lipopolysaccharide transport system permease protein
MIDFTISLLIIIFVMVYYQLAPTWNLLLLPFLILLMMSVPLATGLWLSSLAIRFRDVKHAMPFVIRMLIYTAPIVYSATSIPGNYRFIYSLNPLVAVIEGFRACILGSPVPWSNIWPGAMTAVVITISGLFYFNRTERVFADVI